MRPDFDRAMAPTSPFGRNGYRVAYLPEPGDPIRPATVFDVIIELGEYVGDGVPRDLSGCPFEPLDPSNYGGAIVF